jgi:ATP-grasp domain, R2K clade family 2
VLEVQGLDEESPVPDLATASRPHEPPKLVLRAATYVGALPLQGAEGPQLASGLRDLLDPLVAERPDELVLEIPDADEESVRLELPRQPGPKQGSTELAGLLLVAQPGQPQVESTGAEPVEIAPDVRRPTHVHDGHALRAKVEAAPYRQGLERHPVAGPLDEDDGTEVHAGVAHPGSLSGDLARHTPVSWLAAPGFDIVADMIVLPPRLTETAEALRGAAEDRGFETVQLDSFTLPPWLRARHLYGDTHFADAVAGPLELGLLEAPEGWLTSLAEEFLLREVRLMTMGEAHQLGSPLFIKSANDKTVPAMIYVDGSRLPGPDAIDPGVRVLVSDIAHFRAEVRLHVLDGHVHVAQQYAADGRRSRGAASLEALAFGERLLAAEAERLPSAIVVDIGLTDAGWAVIEANAAWASGGNGADPQLLLDVVLCAARPVSTIDDRDRPFLRPAGG